MKSFTHTFLAALLARALNQNQPTCPKQARHGMGSGARPRNAIPLSGVKQRMDLKDAARRQQPDAAGVRTAPRTRRLKGPNAGAAHRAGQSRRAGARREADQLGLVGVAVGRRLSQRAELPGTSVRPTVKGRQGHVLARATRTRTGEDAVHMEPCASPLGIRMAQPPWQPAWRLRNWKQNWVLQGQGGGSADR